MCFRKISSCHQRDGGAVRTTYRKGHQKGKNGEINTNNNGLAGDRAMAEVNAFLVPRSNNRAQKE